VITLEVADLVVIASRTLGLDTGQVLDLLDPAAAERALALVRPGSGPATRPAWPPSCCTRWCGSGHCGAATSRSRWRPCCSSWV